MITKDEYISQMGNYFLSLRDEEKSDSTISKYNLGLRTFQEYAENRKWDKALKDGLIEYKQYLEQKYAISTANVYIIALNSYLKFLNKPHLCIKTLKLQEQRSNIENSLTMDEYVSMSNIAKTQKTDDTYYMMLAIVSLGIRVGELRYLTVEAIKNKGFTISNKGKIRFVAMPKNLCDILNDYCARRNIRDGYVFFARSPQKAINRTTISRRMKTIAKAAKIDESKAFPHSFRHLFAKRYMDVVGNITGLMNLLGHANIKTTMVYTYTTNDEKRKDMDKLGFY